MGHGKCTKDVAPEPGLGRPTGVQLCRTALPPNHWCQNGLSWLEEVTEIFRNSVRLLFNITVMKKISGVKLLWEQSVRPQKSKESTSLDSKVLLCGLCPREVKA